MGGEFLTGAGYVLRGFRLLWRPGVRAYVLVPLAINLLLFGAVLGYGGHWFGQLMDTWMPQWLRWLDWLLWLVFGILAAGLIFFGFAVVANLLGSPFNGFLAEAVERELTGVRPAAGGSDRNLLAEAATDVMAEFRKIAYFAPRALPLLLLFVVPGLNLFAPFLWFLFGAWASALTYIDYPMANHRIDFPAQRRRAAKRRALTLGFGTAVMAVTLTPVLNFIAMPTAVAGATALWIGHLREMGD